MKREGFTLANFPNDSASTGTADIKKYYSKTLPNIIYNNDPSMNLANLTKTSNPRTSTASSVLDNDWKKNIDFASNNAMSAKIAECQGSGVGDKFAQLSSLASSVDTTSRLRCGWLYNNSNYTQGRGALGINSGPIEPNLSGTWMWDLNAAKKKYHTDICKNVTGCADIGASIYQGRCGWCTKSGKAVPISGNQVAYPYDLATACPPNKLKTTSASCSEGFINPSPCTQSENGALPRDCLLQKLASVGCSDSGTLYQALNSGSDNDYLSNLRPQVPWSTYQQRAVIPLDETGLKTGKISIADAINGFSRVQEHAASTANGGLQYAARDLCLNKGIMDSYDFCSEIADSSNGPFSLDCLQKVFLKSGGQNTGRKYPSGSNIAEWTANGSWSQVKAAVKTLKNNTQSSDRVIQENAMMDFYGIQLENMQTPFVLAPPPPPPPPAVAAARVVAAAPAAAPPPPPAVPPAPAVAAASAAATPPVNTPYISNVGFVRIQGFGKSDCLNLSQLVVYNDKGENISKGRPVQSSQATWNTVASTANDGNEVLRGHPYEFHGPCSGTDFWQVKLDSPTIVSRVVIYNRSDSCCSYRMGTGYVIQLYTPGNQLLWTSNTLNSNLVQEITVSSVKSSVVHNVRFVRIQGTGKSDCLNLSQLVVYDYNGINVSRGRRIQSSPRYAFGGDAKNANDGNETPRPYPYVFHGECSGSDFWQVQLDGPTTVSAVVIYNRSDCCSFRMGSGYIIQLYNSDNKLLWSSKTLNGDLIQRINVG